MSTLANLIKSRRDSGQGVIGSLGQSLRDKIKESVDPRRILNQSGILTALFPKLRAFKAKPIKAKPTTAGLIEKEPEALNPIFEAIETDTQISAKNSMVLPAMHRDVNVIRRNVIKLVKLEGGESTNKADMWLKKSASREATYENVIKEKTPKQEKAAKAPNAPKQEKVEKPKSKFGDAVSTIKSFGSKITSKGMAKAAVGTAVAGAAGLTALTAKGESAGGDYNIVVGGSRANLTSMTIGEVLQFQQQMRASKKYPSTAVGNYQIIDTTLKGAVESLGLNLNDKFDKSMQDRIFKEYLIGKKRKGISDYLNANVEDSPKNLERAQMQLAMEFASYGVPRDVKANEFGAGVPKRDIRKGQSFYAGDGVNKASISPEESGIALKQDRMRNEGKVVVPHPKETPTAVPVPKKEPELKPKFDGNMISAASEDVIRNEDKTVRDKEVLIKELVVNQQSSRSKGSTISSNDNQYSEFLTNRIV